MVEVREIETNSLSHFHTQNRFLSYGEFTSVEDYIAYRQLAKERSLPLYILANGSNTFFRSRVVKTLVLKNKLPSWMNPLDNNRVEASSSLNVSVILKHCQKNQLDSFYYLASVPATVGGAIAMNAGRGRKYNKSIFDFIESVTYLDGDDVVTRRADEISRDYRETIFTGLQDKLVLSAIFQFNPSTESNDQIMARVEFSKQEQDRTGPNCGSVFKAHHSRILVRLRGLRIGKAHYSAKTINWIINRSPNPWHVRCLIRIAKLAHFLLGKKAVVEIIEVD